MTHQKVSLRYWTGPFEVPVYSILQRKASQVINIRSNTTVSNLKKHQKWTSLHLFGRKKRYWQTPLLNPFEALFFFLFNHKQQRNYEEIPKHPQKTPGVREAMRQSDPSRVESSLIQHGTVARYACLSFRVDDDNTTVTNMQQVFDWVFLRFFLFFFYYHHDYCCFKHGNRMTRVSAIW